MAPNDFIFRSSKVSSQGYRPEKMCCCILIEQHICNLVSIKHAIGLFSYEALVMSYYSISARKMILQIIGSYSTINEV